MKQRDGFRPGPWEIRGGLPEEKQVCLRVTSRRWKQGVPVGGHGSSKGGEAGEPGEFRDPRWQGKVGRCCQKLPVQTFVEPQCPAWHLAGPRSKMVRRDRAPPLLGPQGGRPDKLQTCPFFTGVVRGRGMIGGVPGPGRGVWTLACSLEMWKAPTDPQTPSRERAIGVELWSRRGLKFKCQHCCVVPP